MLVDGLVEYIDVDHFKADLAALPGTKILQLPGKLLDLFTDAIKIVEKIVADSGEVGLGKEKRDAVVDFLEKAIEVPFYLETIDGYIIGLIVDTIVGVLNKFFGKTWLKDIPTPS
jgi:hypothetical protein